MSLTCSYCGQDGFTRKGSLSTHEKYCDQNSEDPDTKKVRKAAKNRDTKGEYQCDGCGKKFDNQYKYMGHCSSHTDRQSRDFRKGEYTCENCGGKFSERGIIHMSDQWGPKEPGILACSDEKINNKDWEAELPSVADPIKDRIRLLIHLHTDIQVEGNMELERFLEDDSILNEDFLSLLEEELNID